MKIIYTDSAIEELARFQKQQQDELESLLRDKKYLFGDDIVEITASDIREVSKYFQVIKAPKFNFKSSNILLKAYMLMGVGMMITGLFYSEIISLVEQSPLQLSLVLGGILLTLSSFLASYWIKIRDVRRAELQKKYLEYEKEITSMSRYVVNKNAQENGDHEVHNLTTGCNYLPDPTNLKSLGRHGNCQSALREAKQAYNQSNGCYYCCNSCHAG